MGLAPGTHLGPYEIEQPVGAGGMGEVYRAKDTRLDRTVAVKVLLESHAADELARARLEREARSVSSLSHPNICALYDLGHDNGVDYLVMEYLQGETLAARLESGALPSDDALLVAGQIIDALATAHRQGFIHRDLKPGNVMLTKTGAKLLDFGLAKAVDARVDPAASLTAAPTATTPLTVSGTIMGTFQYMSPEQLEGKQADARSDLFAFGATLYEMLTGRKAFTGSSQASLVAAILKEEPPLVSVLAPTAPVGLDRLVERCLAKKPDERWHSASDLGHELRMIAAGTSVTGQLLQTSAGRTTAATGDVRLAWTAAALLGVATIVFGIMSIAPRDTAPPVPTGATVAFELHPREGDSLRLTGGFAAPPAVSPDGRKIVYGTFEPDEQNRLWLRNLDSTEARALPGTENAIRPFWSPDSHWIGFFSRGQLMRLEIAGGIPLPICSAYDGRGATWGPDGVIVFAPQSTGGLFKVSTSGSKAEPVTVLDTAARHASHRYPSFLPGTDRFIYLVIGSAAASGTGAEAESEVWASSLSGETPRLVLRGAANAQFAKGELLFFRGGALMAHPIDPARLELTGEVRTVVPEIQYDAPFERGIFSVSSDLLVYRAGTFEGLSTLRWYAPDGEELGALGSAGNYSSLAISQDSRSVAFAEQGQGSTDVWINDSVSGRQSRLSFEGDITIWPRWSPDGKQISYLRVNDAGWGLAIAAATGEGMAEYVLRGDRGFLVSPLGWTADSRRILIYRSEGEGAKIGVVDAQPNSRPEWLFELLGGQIRWCRLSPDNRWLAYSSNRTGRWEVYVTPFPNADGTRQISTDGGLEPIWAADGKALYFRAGGQMILKADLEIRGDALSVSNLNPVLGVLSNWAGSDGTTYDVAKDGRLLVSAMDEVEARVPMTAVLHWR